MSHPLLSLLDRPVAFHRPLADIRLPDGSRLGVLAALMLSQALYWTARTDDPEGWFWKTREEWYEETGLSRREQETARRRLRQSGFWHEERRGVPARIYFRVDLDALQAALMGEREGPSPNGNSAPPNRDGHEGDEAPVKMGGSVPSSWADSAQLDGTDPPNKKGGIRPTNTYTTAETTTERAPPLAGASGGARPRAKPPDGGGSAEKRKKSKRAASSPRDDPKNHPAVQAYREIFHLWPSKAQMRLLAKQVDGDDEALERWRAACEAWALAGYRPTNVAGILDWYHDPSKRKRPAHRQAGKTASSPSEPRGFQGIREYLERKEGKP